jgi:hypothetical protein
MVQVRVCSRELKYNVQDVGFECKIGGIPKGDYDMTTKLGTKWGVRFTASSSTILDAHLFYIPTRLVVPTCSWENTTSSACCSSFCGVKCFAAASSEKFVLSSSSRLQSKFAASSTRLFVNLATFDTRNHFGCCLSWCDMLRSMWARRKMSNWESLAASTFVEGQ